MSVFDLGFMFGVLIGVLIGVLFMAFVERTFLPWLAHQAFLRAQLAAGTRRPRRRG
jgi:hypothetical protein